MNNFIKDLDNRYYKEKKKYNVAKNSKKYIFFTPLKFEQRGYVNDSFLIRKEKFTKYLYCKDGVRVYFSDADILTMLLQIKEKETMSAIIESLKQLYYGKGEIFYIYIQEKNI